MAAGHALKLRPGTGGASGPRMSTVPSTLPVGPSYTGRSPGVTTAAALALGIGRPFDGAVGFGGAIVFADAEAGADAAEPESRLQPTTEARAPTRVAVTTARLRLWRSVVQTWGGGMAGSRRIGLG